MKVKVNPEELLLCRWSTKILVGNDKQLFELEIHMYEHNINNFT